MKSNPNYIKVIKPTSFKAFAIGDLYLIVSSGDLLDTMAVYGKSKQNSQVDVFAYDNSIDYSPYYFMPLYPMVAQSRNVYKGIPLFDPPKEWFIQPSDKSFNEKDLVNLLHHYEKYVQLCFSVNRTKIKTVYEIVTDFINIKRKLKDYDLTIDSVIQETIDGTISPSAIHITVTSWKEI